MNIHSVGLACLLLVQPVTAQIQGELLLGTPAQSQNVSIQHLDGRLSWEWLEMSPQPCRLDTSGRLGVLDVNNENALRAGGEAIVACQLSPRWQMELPLGMIWLSDYQFGQTGQRKDYGGPWQFVAALGLSYAISAEWSLGYEFSHMSNWNLYDSNPTLNSHNLLIAYHF